MTERVWSVSISVDVERRGDHVGEAEDERFGVKADPWKENVALREANGRLSEDRETLQALVEKLGTRSAGTAPSCSLMGRIRDG